MMATKLSFISKRAREDKRMSFNNLMHLVNERNLHECFARLKKDKAPGVDSLTLEEYGENLKENVESLVYRMRRLSYRPQPVRRVYIPKAGGKHRPLGIPAVEDKLVQIRCCLPEYWRPYGRRILCLSPLGFVPAVVVTRHWLDWIKS